MNDPRLCRRVSLGVGTDQVEVEIEVRPRSIRLPRLPELSVYTAEVLGKELLECARAARVLDDLQRSGFFGGSMTQGADTLRCSTCSGVLREGVHRVADGKGGYSHALGSPDCSHVG